MNEYPLSILIGIYYAIVGLLIGSFLNVCIYRIPIKISIVKGNKGHSFCPECKHDLNALDLVPLFSYIFLRGKCRYCKAPISIRYPLVEGLTSLSYLLSFLCYGFSSQSIILCAFFSVLIVMAFIDYDTQIVFDRFHIIIIGLGILSYVLPLITHEDEFLGLSILDRIIGLFAATVPLLIIIYIYYKFLHKDGMGGGDIKMFGACGFFLGWKLILLTLLISSVIGAVFGVIFLLKNAQSLDEESDAKDEASIDDEKSDVKDEANIGDEEIDVSSPKFAFVPCIAIGCAITALFGNSLINWYLALFQF